jgi:hypothetical protein
MSVWWGGEGGKIYIRNIICKEMNALDKNMSFTHRRNPAMLACPFLLASWVLLASSNKLSQVISPSYYPTFLLFCTSCYLAILPSHHLAIQST